MKSKRNSILLVLFLALAFQLQSQEPIKINSVKIQILMDNAHLDSCGFHNDLVNAFCSLQEGEIIMLSSGHCFYLLGDEGFYRLAGSNTKNDSISSFGMISSNKLVTIVDDMICVFGERGNLIPIFQLPDVGMELSVSEEVIYAYDKNEEKDEYSLYAYVEEGEVQITTLESPINDALGFGNKVYLCSENVVYELDIAERKAKALCTIDDDETIVSLAVDPNREVLYFATEDYVCRLIDNKLDMVSLIGGKILFDEKGLLVFNVGSRFIYRLLYGFLYE